MSEDICIICQDSGNELLIENILCNCKYKRHNSCWLEYTKTKTVLTCLQCRKVLDQNIIPPYLIPHPRELPVQYYQTSNYQTSNYQPNHIEISYQQLQDIIRNISTAQTISTTAQLVEQPIVEQPINKKTKIIKIVVLIAILLVISILLIEFID